MAQVLVLVEIPLEHSGLISTSVDRRFRPHISMASQLLDLNYEPENKWRIQNQSHQSQKLCSICLRYFTVPPEKDPSEIHLSAKIVNEVAAEFNVDSYHGMESADLNKIIELNDKEMKSQPDRKVAEVCVDSIPLKTIEDPDSDEEAENEDEDEEMEEDGEDSQDKPQDDVSLLLSYSFLDGVSTGVERGNFHQIRKTSKKTGNFMKKTRNLNSCNLNQKSLSSPLNHSKSLSNYRFNALSYSPNND